MALALSLMVWHSVGPAQVLRRHPHASVLGGHHCSSCQLSGEGRDHFAPVCHASLGPADVPAGSWEPDVAAVPEHGAPGCPVLWQHLCEMEWRCLYDLACLLHEMY